MTGRCMIRLLGVAACGALIVAPASTAAAKTAKPLVTAYAWYWENQKQQSVEDPTSGADVVTAGPGNAFFCPGAEGVANPEQSCKPGRLPAEVLGGDYKSPDKVSAVAFDLSIAPIGSKVTKFTASFLEASDGQSQSYNIDGKKLEACLVTKIFGGGEARRYNELPKHKCSKAPILATRSKAKPAKGDAATDRFQWTFDLTAPAKKWVKQGQFATGILIRPFEPKKTGPDTANWRVVLEGSENPKGIQTQLEFIPAKLPDLLGGGDLGGGDLGGGGGLGGGATFSAPSTDSGDLGSGEGTVASEETSEAGATEEGAEEPQLAADETASVPGGLPGYVWLALLAGLIGFSAVRSVVFEHPSGVRPNGVLAQIQQLNARRRGTAVVTPGPANPLAPLLAGVKSFGGKARAVLVKLPVRRKG